MAKLEIDNGIDDMIKMFDKLENSDEAAKKAVTKASRVVEKSIRAAVPKRTGGLANSFFSTDAKKNQWGYYSVVRPVGSDSKGVSYARIAAFNEYGTDKYAGRPYITKATKSAQAEAEKVMQEVFDEALREITGD